jgi:hypothetical protein
MPVYEPKVKDIYDGLTLPRKESMMDELGFNRAYAVYNYGELPSKIQEAVNKYFNDLDVREGEDDQAMQRKLFDQNPLIVFKSEEDLNKAIEGFQEPNNYGPYLKQFRSQDFKLDKYIKGFLEPPGNPGQRKTLLNKRREELNDPNFEWTKNTTDNQVQLIKKYFETKPSKSILDFEKVDGNSLMFPLAKNTLTRTNIENILDTVLKNIGIDNYKMTTKKTSKDITKENLLKELINKVVSEKKMTSAQKKKRGEIYDTLVKQGMSSKKAGPIATSQAMKEGFPDLNNDNEVTYADVLIGRGVKPKNEDIDLGHQDDEPHMLKANVYRIAKYAIELYKMLDKYDKMEKEIDFPDWWQEKIHLTKDYLVKAKHYLDFEEKEPSLDAMLGEEEKKKGRRYIPQTFKFPKDIIKVFGKNFEYYGGKMYALPLVKTALGQLTPGRKSYTTTKGYSDLATLIDEKMPQQVRMAIKKGLENAKPIEMKRENQPPIQMLPIELNITKDESGDYIIKNPYLNKLAEIKVKPGNTGTVKRYNVTFRQEDWIDDNWLFGTLHIDKAPELESIDPNITAQYSPNQDKIRIEFYPGEGELYPGKDSSVFKNFLNKNQIKYITKTDKFPDHEYNEYWFDIDNVSKYFDITKI